jgi:hypothetical protein
MIPTTSVSLEVKKKKRKKKKERKEKKRKEKKRKEKKRKEKKRKEKKRKEKKLIIGEKENKIIYPFTITRWRKPMVLNRW